MSQSVSPAKPFDEGNNTSTASYAISDSLGQDLALSKGSRRGKKQDQANNYRPEPANRRGKRVCTPDSSSEGLNDRSNVEDPNPDHGGQDPKGSDRPRSRKCPRLDRASSSRLDSLQKESSGLSTDSQTHTSQPQSATCPATVDLADDKTRAVKLKIAELKLLETTNEAGNGCSAPSGSGSPKLLSKEIVDGTSLSVRVSNQPDIAPAFVNLGLCCDIEALFIVLLSECEIQTSATAKITKISATFPWNGKQLRLRKGRLEDWKLFCNALRHRWQNPADLNDGTCEVELLVHVDG